MIRISTDPGDLALDPTCGSGTTAFVTTDKDSGIVNDANL
jgi:hypothetical protein